MKTLYLAKEPGKGVRDDLSRISGEVVVVDCLNSYNEWYKKKGYSCISTNEFFDLTGMKFDVVIGNPPYGKNSSLAVKFLNKASELSDNVHMVLPRTFHKPSIINRLNPKLHLVSDVDVDESAFRGSIIACVQKWEVREEEREKIQTYTTHKDFTFCKKEEADICLGRVGGGPSGKIFDEWENRSVNSHYFLKVSSPQVIENLRSLSKEFRSAALQTVGCPSLSKDDCVKVYSSHFE
jgi:hypothetical protein